MSFGIEINGFFRGDGRSGATTKPAKHSWFQGIKRGKSFIQTIQANHATVPDVMLWPLWKAALIAKADAFPEFAFSFRLAHVLRESGEAVLDVLGDRKDGDGAGVRIDWLNEFWFHASFSSSLMRERMAK